MMQGFLLRALLIAAVLIAAWMLFLAFAGTILLVCLALAGWRLWRLAAGMPGRGMMAAAASPDLASIRAFCR